MTVTSLSSTQTDSAVRIATGYYADRDEIRFDIYPSDNTSTIMNISVEDARNLAAALREAIKPAKAAEKERKTAAKVTGALVRVEKEHRVYLVDSAAFDGETNFAAMDHKKLEEIAEFTFLGHTLLNRSGNR